MYYINTWTLFWPSHYLRRREALVRIFLAHLLVLDRVLRLLRGGGKDHEGQDNCHSGALVSRHGGAHDRRLRLRRRTEGARPFIEARAFFPSAKPEGQHLVQVTRRRRRKEINSLRITVLEFPGYILVSISGKPSSRLVHYYQNPKTIIAGAAVHYVGFHLLLYFFYMWGYKK